MTVLRPIGEVALRQKNIFMPKLASIHNFIDLFHVSNGTTIQLYMT